MYISLCVYVHVNAGSQRDQKRESNPLELDLQAVLSCLKWVLGLKSQSSTSILTHEVISPVLILHLSLSRLSFGLAMQLKLALNSGSSCLCLLSTGIVCTFFPFLFSFLSDKHFPCSLGAALNFGPSSCLSLPSVR